MYFRVLMWGSRTTSTSSCWFSSSTTGPKDQSQVVRLVQEYALTEQIHWWIQEAPLCTRCLVTTTTNLS